MARPRTAPDPLSEDRSFSPLGLFGLVIRALAAYFFAFWLYVVSVRVSRLPQFSLLDESTRATIFFVVLVIVIALILLVLMQSIWGGQTRGFGLMMAVILAGLAITQSAGFTHIDPMAAPAELLRSYFLQRLPIRF